MSSLCLLLLYNILVYWRDNIRFCSELPQWIRNVFISAKKNHILSRKNKILFSKYCCVYTGFSIRQLFVLKPFRYQLQARAVTSVKNNKCLIIHSKFTLKFNYEVVSRLVFIVVCCSVNYFDKLSSVCFTYKQTFPVQKQNLLICYILL